MKFKEFQKRIRNSREFVKTNKEIRRDLGFQMAYRVEGLRLNFGLSQTEFARQTKLSQPAVARLERGNIVPSLPMLQRIADAFKVELILPAFASSRPSAVDTDAATQTNQADQERNSPYFIKSNTGTKDIVQVA